MILFVQSRPPCCAWMATIRREGERPRRFFTASVEFPATEHVDTLQTSAFFLLRLPGHDLCLEDVDVDHQSQEECLTCEQSRVLVVWLQQSSTGPIPIAREESHLVTTVLITSTIVAAASIVTLLSSQLITITTAILVVQLR